MHASPSRSLTRVLLALLLLVGLAAGCSSKGKSDGEKADTTTTAAEPDETTTTEPEETTTTTEDSPFGEAPSEDTLRGLLPPASKLGAGWNGPEDSVDSGSGISDALTDQCPDAKLDSDDDDSDDIEVEYAKNDGAQLSISFDRTVKDYDDEQFQGVIDAINACDTVTYDDPDNGNKYEIKLQATTDDKVGDQAAKMAATFQVTTSKGQRITFNSYAYAIRRGPVGMVVTGIDAISDSGQVTDFDTDLLDNVATTLDGLVEAEL